MNFQNCLELWEKLLTQAWYPILKHNPKIDYIENAVILPIIIFSSLKSHMYIFNMPVTSVRSFKLIAWKLCDTTNLLPYIEA